MDVIGINDCLAVAAGIRSGGGGQLPRPTVNDGDGRAR